MLTERVAPDSCYGKGSIGISMSPFSSGLPAGGASSFDRRDGDPDLVGLELGEAPFEEGDPAEVSGGPVGVQPIQHNPPIEINNAASVSRDSSCIVLPPYFSDHLILERRQRSVYGIALGFASIGETCSLDDESPQLVRR